MNQWLRSGLGRYALLSALLFLAAGCNGGGGTSSDGFSAMSSDTTALSSLSVPTEETFGSSSTSESSGTEVAQVHNPEPASMALMGLGLLGAAWSKKRNRKVKRG